VAVGSDGRSQFMDLIRHRTQNAILYAFDLLWLNGEDLRPLPLLDRKQRLQKLLKGHAGLLYAKHIEAKGTALFEAICAKDLEGIVAKHRDGPYTSAPMSWFKVLNPTYSQKRGRREMFDKFRERDKSPSEQRPRA
jgi:bifunctional non-homologous end joining protein LigD